MDSLELRRYIRARSLRTEQRLLGEVWSQCRDAVTSEEELQMLDRIFQSYLDNLESALDNLRGPR